MSNKRSDDFFNENTPYLNLKSEELENNFKPELISKISKIDQLQQADNSSN